MAETLTDVDQFDGTIQMPTAGETVSAADLRDKAIQRLANRTRYLGNRLIDALSGGTYTPVSTLSIANLHCPTTPASVNAVANKSYVDAREAFLQGELDTAEAEIDALQALSAVTLSAIQTAITHSNLTNISAVNSTTDALIVLRRGNYVHASGHFNVTNSASGEKSFDFTLPYMVSNFAQQYHLSGSGAAYNAGGSYPAMVYAVTGTQTARCEWFSTDTTGSVPVRVSFGYFIGT